MNQVQTSAPGERSVASLPAVPDTPVGVVSYRYSNTSIIQRLTVPLLEVTGILVTLRPRCDWLQAEGCGYRPTEPGAHD
jgi:hypothetical protein